MGAASRTAFELWTTTRRPKKSPLESCEPKRFLLGHRTHGKGGGVDDVQRRRRRSEAPASGRRYGGGLDGAAISCVAATGPIERLKIPANEPESEDA